MCGRFVGNFSTQDIYEELSAAVEAAGLRMLLPDTDLPLLRNFNVAPTHAVPILRVVDGSVVVDVVQWGLLPVWSKDATKHLDSRPDQQEQGLPSSLRRPSPNSAKSLPPER